MLSHATIDAPSEENKSDCSEPYPACKTIITLPSAVSLAVLKLPLGGLGAESVEGPPAEHKPASEGRLSRRVQEAV